MRALWSHPRARALFLAAIALSLGLHAWLLIARPVQIGQVSRDSDEYWRIATNIVSGHGYSRDGLMPTRMRMPGYPLFLAGLQLLCGPNVMAPLTLQSLLNIVTLVLLATLAARLFGPMTGGLTALLIALYLPLPVMGVRIMAEALYIAVLTGAVVCWLRALETRQLAWFAATGALVGIAGLVKSSGLPLLVLLMPIIWLQLGRSWQALGRGFVAAALGLIVMLPWGVRNWMVLDKPTLASTDSETCLWFGTHPYNRTHWPEYATPFFDLPEFRAIVGDDYYLQEDVSSELARAARERVEANPIDFLKLGFWKVSVTWTYLPGTRPLAARAPLIFTLARVPQVLVLLLAIWGAVRSPARLWSVALTLAVIISGGLFLGHATARYTMPVMPLAMLFVAVLFSTPSRRSAGRAASRDDA